MAYGEPNFLGVGCELHDLEVHDAREEKSVKSSGGSGWWQPIHLEILTFGHTRCHCAPPYRSCCA
jgi:hypothetical protein